MIVAERGSCIFAAHDAISPKSGERVLGSDLQRARRVASQIRAGARRDQRHDGRSAGTLGRI